MLECVPNVSEGRDAAVLGALVHACGTALLDCHVDADHHRSVFTLAGDEPDVVAGAVRDLARAVDERVDLRVHEGVHPRFGALDVVPFVALHGDPAARWSTRRGPLRRGSRPNCRFPRSSMTAPTLTVGRSRTPDATRSSRARSRLWSFRTTHEAGRGRGRRARPTRRGELRARAR